MDSYFMKRALKLAKKGKGFVEPNPLVGAVIVRDDKIIGEGYHKKFGYEHAEVNAFLNATEDVKGADMYVTLEPCSHYGKTPPCASLIIEKKISRVVIASRDPNPLVAGKGIDLLRKAGIEVEVGLLDKENKLLNKVFFKYIQDNKPFIVLKTAMTLDGKIATYTNQSKWISNDKSRKLVHQMRHELMAIMVGVKTVIYDDPKLTCRLNKKNIRQPIRIVLDTNLEIPMDSYLVKTAKDNRTIVFAGKDNQSSKKQVLIESGLEVFSVAKRQEGLDLNQVTDILAKEGISSVLLEGGATLNFGALKAGIVDEIHSFIAPKIVGGRDAITPVGGIGIADINKAFKLELIKVSKIDEDVHLIYKVLKEA